MNAKETRTAYNIVIALRNLLVSVVQVLKVLEFFIVFLVPIAIYMVHFTTSLHILSPLPSLLLVDESSGPTPIPMLYRANDKAVTRELGA
jgi:hypothetical protein